MLNQSLLFFLFDHIQIFGGHFIFKSELTNLGLESHSGSFNFSNNLNHNLTFSLQLLIADNKHVEVLLEPIVDFLSLVDLLLQLLLLILRPFSLSS